MLTPNQVEEFLETLTNPRFIENYENGPILLDGIYNGSPLEFIASPKDPMEYGRKIHRKCLEGFYGVILPFSDKSSIQKNGNKKDLF